ncbi:MAG TPA: hypothetical protein VF980_13615 [Thermoanaerobaculia bacterium]
MSSIDHAYDYGVKTLPDLERCADDDILHMNNLGAVSLSEIREQFAPASAKRR